MSFLIQHRCLTRGWLPAILPPWLLLTLITLVAHGQSKAPEAPIPPVATDTLRISLPDLEQQVLARNYQLLAQRYQIDIAGASITQAGLRTNPNLWFQTNLYNPNTGKVLPLATPSQADINAQTFNSGYFAVQLQQVILLAGKRSKLVALAESNRTLAQIAFRDVLRSLRYQLYSTYANLYFDIQALNLFQAELARQQRLVESYRIAQQTGGVAPYEVTRLDVSNRDLQANIANYRGQIADEQATLRILLQQASTKFIFPTEIPATSRSLPALSAALDSALTNRPDLALTQEQINNASRSLSLERARRVPDLTTGVLFERYGNAYVNFTGLQVAMDLPVRNRNQGAIRAAELTAKSVQAGVENQQAVVQSDVLNAYDKLNAYYDQANTRPPGYLDRIQNISVEATKAYNARVIGLLDYLDKIRTYQQAQLNNINLLNNLFQSQQQLDYVTNTKFF
ncbi:TolC family protein [Fibrella aquatilis]|uniref:TolC family protein n=1 Tax=Fibrella aquatilis TaxID=2817059 RepID=A0A939G673_9BACT|nr:TolC family protein [Fibrella aquatilis]MBO0932899.1 TolC family protein [Fibrella aquatilis]